MGSTVVLVGIREKMKYRMCGGARGLGITFVTVGLMSQDLCPLVEFRSSQEGKEKMNFYEVFVRGRCSLQSI